MNNLPVEPLIESCERVIGVNVTPVDHEARLGNLLDIGSRVFELSLWANVESRLQQCDIKIEPHADQFGIFELSKAQDIYDVGYEKTMECRDHILESLATKSPNMGTQFKDWWSRLGT